MITTIFKGPVKTLLAAVIVSLGVAGTASAFDGILPLDNSPVFVQNVKGIVPQKGSSTCVTKNLTHGGTITTFNVTDSVGRYYLQMLWSSFKSATDSTPVVVKRSLDSNTSYMPASSEYLTIGKSASFSTVKFATFSNTSTAAANANYTICADFQ